MDLAVQIYQLARHMPKTETYGLISQMTRAATSVPANIAEGNARGTRRDYAHFLAISRGSLTETETLLTLTIRLGYLSTIQAQPVQELITEIGKMLTALRQRLLS